MRHIRQTGNVIGMEHGKNSKKSKLKNRISTLALLFVMLVGLSVMLYPVVSDWYNSRLQSEAISLYNAEVEKLGETQYEREKELARDYNERLAKTAFPLVNYDSVSGYEQALDITGTGIMGYITIPDIDVDLPIYHGTGEGVLNVAVGHMQGTSLPVGGEGNHCVISAHRGLPSAKLFSDLDKLVKGDIFTVTVLDETLTYEVEDVFIITPDNVSYLALVEGRDYLTLTTCTPYGVNTHRLLVRAHRIDNAEAEKLLRVSADGVQVDSMKVVPFVAAPLFVGLLIVWFSGGKRKPLPCSRPLSVLERKTGSDDGSADSK